MTMNIQDKIMSWHDKKIQWRDKAMLRRYLTMLRRDNTMLRRYKPMQRHFNTIGRRGYTMQRHEKTIQDAISRCKDKLRQDNLMQHDDEKNAIWRCQDAIWWWKDTLNVKGTTGLWLFIVFPIILLFAFISIYLFLL